MDEAQFRKDNGPDTGPNRLVPVLKTIFHQCVISYTDASLTLMTLFKTEPSELD